MVKYCTQCGEPNEDNAGFCIKCGHGFKPVAQDKPAATGNQPTTPQTQAGSISPGPQPTQPTQMKYCQDCGNLASINAPYCSICGSTTFAATPPAKISRPTGVTVLAILEIIVGAISLAIASIITLIFPPLGLVFLIVPILAIIFALALFTGRNWARILALIGGVLLLFDIPIGTILGIVMLWYLTRPRIAAYFKQRK